MQCRVHIWAYMLFIISGVLFPSSFRDTVHAWYMQLLMMETEIRDYALHATVLTYLYRGLTKCAMLLMYGAYERLALGSPKIAPHQELQWSRTDAWTQHVMVRRVNPYHHTRIDAWTSSFFPQKLTSSPLSIRPISYSFPRSFIFSTILPITIIS